MKNNWIDKWREDIEQLELELPKQHKHLFFHIKKKDFYKQIKALKNNLKGYDNYMIVAGIASIVASARDAHTTVTMAINRFMPFEFYWFKEGIFIVASICEHAYAQNCRVTHFNGISINEVIDKVERIVSHENDSFLKAQLPKYLPAIEVLYGLEIADGFEHVELTLEKQNGEAFLLAVETYDYSEVKGRIIENDGVSEECLPLYRRNKDKRYWSFFIEEQKTLYFNYNSCRNMQDISVEAFCTELMSRIESEDVKKLVIDLRNNLGGNSTLLDPFIKELSKCMKLNKEGGIFVILGRETFSSALLNAYSLKKKTKAIFVGEASGGKPNCYGEVQHFNLKNSMLKVSYSTKYYDIIEDDQLLSFFPDINIEISIKHYINRVDPCMEYILKA